MFEWMERRNIQTDGRTDGQTHVENEKKVAPSAQNLEMHVKKCRKLKCREMKKGTQPTNH